MVNSSQNSGDRSGEPGGDGGDHIEASSQLPGPACGSLESERWLAGLVAQRASLGIPLVGNHDAALAGFPVESHLARVYPLLVGHPSESGESC